MPVSRAEQLSTRARRDLRDAQEQGAVTARLDQARVDKLLAEHDPFSQPV